MAAVQPCRRGPGRQPCRNYRRGTPYDPTQCLRCWQQLAHDVPNLEPAEGPLSPPRRSVEIPCVHLGGETGEMAQCPTCEGNVQVRLRLCGVHGDCSPRKQLDGHQCCVNCPDRREDTYTLIAPMGTRGVPHCYHGRVRPYPWEYRVTAVIPHLSTPHTLPAVIETLRWQTLRPFVLIVDTGSPPAVCEEIERLRSADVEIHYVRAHGYIHSSEPVAVALDVAHALCRTEWLYHTHADAFAMRRDWLQWLWERCDIETPVVGYQMSPRTCTDEWQGTASHTATMLHMPTIRRIGGCYSLQAWYDRRGLPKISTTGWPDTETNMRDCLKAAGIEPFLIDQEGCEGAAAERNYVRTTDGNIDHCRSYPSSLIYGGTHRAIGGDQIDSAIAEALSRAARWKQEAEGR